MFGGYGSEFDDGNECRKRKSDSIGYKKSDGTRNAHYGRLPSKNVFVDSYEKEQQRLEFAKFKSLNAFERHNKLVHDYLKYYGGKMEDFSRNSSSDKTDFDVIKENHKFIWEEGTDPDDNWGQKLAKKYYDKLFKEYCISDVSRYKDNKFAMRWRTEKEVHIGKGQFICGARKCEEKDGLRSWEVNFGYIEHGKKMNALIKLRLCPDCSYKLNYNKKHRQIKKKKKKEKKKKHKRYKKEEKESTEEGSSDCDSDSSSYKIDHEKESNISSSASSNSPSIWKDSMKESTEKTINEMFDDYLGDLFM